MNKQRDELIEMLGMGISRRQMLKGMGYGLVGALAAPAVIKNVWAAPQNPGASPSNFTPQQIWDYSAPESYILYAPPLFNNGTIIITARDQWSRGVLYILDTQTKEVRWSHTFDDETVFLTPLSVGGLLYAAANDGGVYSIDPATGNIRKSDYRAAADLQLIGGNLVFATTDGNLVALDSKLDQVWIYQSGISVGVGGASRAVASGGTAMVRMLDTVVAVDIQTGSFLWSHVAGTISTSELSVGNGKVYFTADDYYLYAVDIASGDQTWKWPQQAANSNELSSPFYYNGAVYAGDGGGGFYALHPDTGSKLWQTSVSGSVTAGQIFFEDGIAYFAAGTLLKSKIYAVDLPSHGQQVAVYDPSSGVELVGMETGVVYFQYPAGLGPHNISAVNLSGIVHQYFCESELMVEDYTSVSDPVNGGRKAQGNTASYRTHVQLFDPNKNPRANKSVKVWASDAVTITSGGQTYDLDTADTGKSAWLQTDAAGELSIVSAASTTSSPALYIWGDFMELDEAIVIYPDHDTLNTLSNVQGSDLTSTKKTTFDGSPLLPAGYSAADDLAATIRNAMGGGVAQAMLKTKERHRQALAKKRRTKKKWTLGASADTTYIAYPDSAPNLLYQPFAGPADRIRVSGEFNQWHAIFDSFGHITFHTGLPVEGPQLLGSLLGDLKKLGHDVVNTAVKVAQVVWDDVNKVVNVVVNEAGDFYQDVADTVEKAVAVVAGALKTVVGDIKKAVEWLSYLFDWDDMLATKDQLKTAALGKFTSLKTWMDNQVKDDLESIHTFFQNIEGSIQFDLEQAKSLVGGSSLQSKQQNGNNPQAAYGAGGAKSYAKSRWMIQKFQDNASHATIGSSNVGDATDTILPVIQQLRTDVATIIGKSPQLQAIPGDIKNAFTDFSQLATDPSDFVTKTFGAVIQLISDIAVSLVQLADAIVESLVKALQQIIDALITLVTQPINIPVLTDLYSLITKGGQLTVLDLCCLLVAVPTTIVSKVLNSLTQSDGAGAPQVGVVLTENIGYVFAIAFYTVADPLMDVFGPPQAMQYFYMGLSTVIQGLNFPTDLATNSSANYLFYAAQVFPIASAGVGIAAGGLDPLDPFKVAWNALSPIANCAYGLAMLGASIGLGVENPQFRGKDYLLMIQNIFSFIPFVFKPLALGGADSKLALGAIDGVCDATTLGLTVAQWIVAEG